ncbi:MAG TPA: FKBP-type peptidyl-prolyl cis-trans isomerase [Candidatus Acidoferrum sp.]|jgi:FKBP-type peptidyl-prolyl cis-trans isomerase|nr:FKBP-type peptidyl-prolyl cis-trans isomerase [Candidatus Acidoferrum sp.]
MKNLLIGTLALLAAGMLLTGTTPAQQAPAATTQQTPAAKPQAATTATTQTAPAPGTQKTPAAKPRQTTRPATQTPLTLKTEKDKVSYALGMNLGTNLHKQTVEVDPAIILRGLKDGLADGKTLLTQEEAQAALTQLQTRVRSKQQEVMKQAGETNKKEGEEFLTANKAKEGVVALPSGLEYRILNEGTGPKPTAADSVSCNYRGTLINGKEFDSSYKRGQPATFPVNGVIKGWTEALQLMPVGSKWQLFIPSELAYGDRGAGADIGPGSALIFEVELLSIQSKDIKDKKDKP